MASDKKTVDFIVDQTAGAGAVSAKAMFGEYGLYCDGKMVGIIGDNQLFIKPTARGRALAVGAKVVSPFPGARPRLLIDPKHWDDSDWMTELVRISSADLPSPKPKSAKRTK